jgi:hypothetical protein
MLRKRKTSIYVQKNEIILEVMSKRKAEPIREMMSVFLASVSVLFIFILKFFVQPFSV